jgi:hypothetical protein
MRSPFVVIVALPPERSVVGGQASGKLLGLKRSVAREDQMILGCHLFGFGGIVGPQKKSAPEQVPLFSPRSIPRYADRETIAPPTAAISRNLIRGSGGAPLFASSCDLSRAQP